jgi:hypothetical protein
MQNLWWYSSEYVNDSINGDPDRNRNLGIVQALANDDEAALRKRIEEVINQIVGNLSDQFLDYDHDGEIDISGDGYGSLPQGEEHLGYIQESALYAQRTADAPDSTTSIRSYNENVQICLQNVEGWTNEILDLALQLNDMPFGPEMETTVSQLSTLGVQLIDGMDANQNGRIDPTAGECGATMAYDNAYYMADFQIYLGPNRIPPSGK